MGTVPVTHAARDCAWYLLPRRGIPGKARIFRSTGGNSSCTSGA